MAPRRRVLAGEYADIVDTALAERSAYRFIFTTSDLTDALREEWPNLDIEQGSVYAALKHLSDAYGYSVLGVQNSDYLWGPTDLVSEGDSVPLLDAAA